MNDLFIERHAYPIDVQSLSFGLYPMSLVFVFRFKWFEDWLTTVVYICQYNETTFLELALIYTFYKTFRGQ